jgi:hypothetical protein
MPSTKNILLGLWLFDFSICVICDIRFVIIPINILSLVLLFSYQFRHPYFSPIVSIFWYSLTNRNQLGFHLLSTGEKSSHIAARCSCTDLDKSPSVQGSTSTPAMLGAAAIACSNCGASNIKLTFSTCIYQGAVGVQVILQLQRYAIFFSIQIKTDKASLHKAFTSNAC